MTSVTSAAALAEGRWQVLPLRVAERQEDGAGALLLRTSRLGEGLDAVKALFGAGDHGGDEGEGQSHNIEVAAVDAGNPSGGVALDGVGSGFPKRLPGGNIPGDFVLGGRKEGDVGDLGGNLSVRGGDEGDAGDDLMRRSGKETQHARGVPLGFRFGEHVATGRDDGGVGAEDEEGFGWIFRGELGADFGKTRGSGDGFGFLAGEAQDVRDRLLAGVGIFGDTGREDGECVSGLSEEIAAARRGGGEEEHQEQGIGSRGQGAEAGTNGQRSD